MNINVSLLKGQYDNFDLGDKRENVPLDPTPVFINMSLDRALLRNVNSFHGGKGTAQYRRALGPDVFGTAWAFVDHIVLPPGASVGPFSYRGIAQFYYVMAGEGTVSLAGRGQQQSAAIRTGDAIPIQLSEVHSIENNGTQPLELMAVGVARDLHKGNGLHGRRRGRPSQELGTMQKPALWILLAGVAVAGQAALGQAPDAGKQLFDTRCARCHGPEGGGGELGPSIVRGIASRSNQDLSAFLTTGSPGRGMPAFPLRARGNDPAGDLSSQASRLLPAAAAVPRWSGKP